MPYFVLVCLIRERESYKWCNSPKAAVNVCAGNAMEAIYDAVCEGNHDKP